MTFKVGVLSAANTQRVPALSVRQLLLNLHAGASTSGDSTCDFVVDFNCDGRQDSTGQMADDDDDNDAVITICDDLLRLLEKESKDRMLSRLAYQASPLTCYRVVAQQDTSIHIYGGCV